MSSIRQAHLFAIPGCPFCFRAREALKAHRIPFSESFPSSSERVQLAKRFNYSRLPIIVVKFRNGKERAILGSDKLLAFFEEKNISLP